eukprot:CAMPEP_0114590926 /NCGR_PEP_ID=MMETSP0125-20121206/13084_1 /TAXON_ID=485358 ORGANISM="Aristerostoma sp., Strain ATCC 50986" /NCGR_SAMPLE_ID=MMETSP0125 /ASSEMBLY_ACC=CAM_ASM_000245 /LENGTH=325 /DNA_ID=CAMNT_0001788721 /DNA_START=55 /DNA_END=1032 /DNA_ORIENTATION=+
MKATIALLCIIALATATNVPPVKDFSLTDLEGEWFIDGTWKLEDGFFGNFTQLPNKLCPTALFSLLNRTAILLEVHYSDLTNMKGVTEFNTLIANDTDPAILSAGNGSLVVGYYSAQQRVAVLVAADESFAFVISRDSEFNNYEEINKFFAACDPAIPADQIIKANNTICEGPENAIYDFNVSALSGYYYVNGHYVVGKDPASCEIMYFSPSTEHKGLVNVTFIADDKVVGTDLFLPLPGRSGQWVPATTQDSLVFGFEDDQNGVWTWITGSEDEGFIISKEAKIGLVEFGIASEYFLASKMDVRHIHTVKNKCSLPSDMLEINA